MIIKFIIMLYTLIAVRVSVTTSHHPVGTSRPALCLWLPYISCEVLWHVVATANVLNTKVLTHDQTPLVASGQKEINTPFQDKAELEAVNHFTDVLTTGVPGR